MADIIKLLPDSVANQIAAGEVIQRPASVVKELMENSVDAGATTINVIIKDAGKTLIQIIDDGCGMSETDARLSFERHATSKISSANDLFAINTKGFRGEALASIAAVAMVELKTRRSENETGTHIIISGSRVEKQEACICPSGSSFLVKNLFYNIPARRKFLKSDNTELRHIISEFQKVAMPHPLVRFTLHHNDNEIYNLATGNLRQRITGLFGKQINSELVGIDTETSLVEVSGFIGKPESARRTYGEQFFFVNNRFMKHPYFHKAVAEAYQNIIPPDVIPSYFIFLKTDPATIDINIHPTKTEIKFEDERAIWQILMASVREGLGRHNIVPSIDFDNEALIDIPVRRPGDQIPESPRIEINPDFDPFRSESRPSMNYSHSAFTGSKNNDNWQKLFPGSATGPEGQIFPGEGYPPAQGRRMLQIRNKFILTPVKSGLMLIDQKRAHERVLFEKFLGQLSENRNISQKRLFPCEIELSRGDFELLSEIKDALALAGFTFTAETGTRVSVTGCPADHWVSSPDPEIMLKIIIDEFKARSDNHENDINERVAASLAAASAIPYGKSLTNIEMEELFDSLFSCKAPNYSPSGKPVLTILTIEDLEKKF
jgi:DNA mismatch repair protein MutL